MRMWSSATAGMHLHVLWCRGHVYIPHVTEQMIQAEYPKHDGNNQRSAIVFVVKGFHGCRVISVFSSIQYCCQSNVTVLRADAISRHTGTTRRT